MPVPFVFRLRDRFGPVQVGNVWGDSGVTGYIAVCEADRCGWSSEYSSYAAACIAARNHRCRIPQH
ncbi:Mobile element transfer [Streptomyces bathyalis]|uniref:Mobile element transfer n=1 Tax=Streptomyces bathyalis TaxID=2710756 RepID=A0A7T1T727_9ACTN|nr:mobile element transfer protein [Streptomyces bathyalis]QPP07573.1 Mobile element transfer [Streptomyces bathyalis]